MTAIFAAVAFGLATVFLSVIYVRHTNAFKNQVESLRKHAAKVSAQYGSLVLTYEKSQGDIDDLMDKLAFQRAQSQELMKDVAYWKQQCNKSRAQQGLASLDGRPSKAKAITTMTRGRNENPKN